MTKEEIIDKSLTSAQKYGCQHIGHDQIEAMMDEYAKQQTIAFDLWKADKGIVSDYNGYHDESQSYRGDELYAQFIEQENQNS